MSWPFLLVCKSLARFKEITDELRSRAVMSREYGLGDPLAAAAAETGLQGNILLVEDRASASERIVHVLGQRYQVVLEPNPQQAVFRAAEAQFDLAIVSLGLQQTDGLRILSQFRSLERTRHMSLLMIGEAEDRQRFLRGLDIGVNDFLMRPVDRNELLARTRTLVRNRRFGERLRSNVATTMEAAVIDQLTGLHNRRYLDKQLPQVFAESKRDERPMSVLVLDIDKFKAVNDTYGHDAGDEVLKTFARRVRACVRGDDLLIRFGGEEIVIVMPDTSEDVATFVAERIRARVEGTGFAIDRGMRQIPVTTSIGVAHLMMHDASPDDILKRADAALYRAKAEGRNRVIRAAA